MINTDLLEAISRLDGTLRALRCELDLGNDDVRLKDKVAEDMGILLARLDERPPTETEPARSGEEEEQP